MTGESVKHILREGLSCGPRGQIIFTEYKHSGEKFYAQLKLGFHITDEHMKRMVIEARALGIQPVLHQQYGPYTFVWLPMDPHTRVTVRDNDVCTFMRRYANWAQTYREPVAAREPKPKPQEAKVIDLTTREAKFTG